MSVLIDKILNEICLDPRISNGVFDISEHSHMDILREYFINKGISRPLVIEFCNLMVEGKYPERQAYNEKGILVTFPTPEYKQRAIKKGTHFEKDPTKKAPNIFDDPAQPGAAPAQAPAADKTADTKKTSLPLSQTQVAEPPAEQPEAGASIPTTDVAPQSTSTNQEKPLEPTELPPPAVKSPEEKQADKISIKKMLAGDDSVLEQVVEWISNDSTLMEKLKLTKKQLTYE